MLVSTILRKLPESLEWMVLFDIAAVRTVADDRLMKEMYFIDQGIDLAPFSHVVLTSMGRYLSPMGETGNFIHGETSEPWPGDQGPSLYDRFSKQIGLFPVDQAHSFALGQLPSYEPVVLHIEIHDGIAHARTLFSKNPSHQHYELLQAVGARYVATEPRRGGLCVVHFQNRLPEHFNAAMLSHFSRTSNCNQLFLLHGNIDAELEAGLLESSEKRIRWKRSVAFQGLEALTGRALAQAMPMLWEAPPPQEPVYFGDVDPLAIALAALRLHPESALCEQLEQRLNKEKLRGLWSFQSNDLETSMDSTLVLLALNDKEAVLELERFNDGNGGYVPQLWAAAASPGKMLFEPEKRHWCQADYATTCFVAAQRKKTGLPPIPATVRFIREGFSSRSGLYYANPYFVDWAVAQAIAGDEDSKDLREQLLGEILSSINEDYTFGRYDRPLSTALAILALDALGYHGRVLRAAQLALTYGFDEKGLLPVTKPFYSSLIVDSAEKGPKNVSVRGYTLGIHYHVDAHRMVGTALAALALSVPRMKDEPDKDAFNKPPHDPPPRYACADHIEYVSRFALPRYLKQELPTG